MHPYSPTLGRWVSVDPIGFAAGDSNLYRYVGNGATNATDPDGLELKKRLIGGRVNDRLVKWLDAFAATAQYYDPTGAIIDWWTAPSESEMRKPIPREFNNGNQSFRGLHSGDSIPRSQKLWADQARSGAPWAAGGTLVLLGTLVVPGPPDKFIDWLKKEGFTLSKQGREVLLKNVASGRDLSPVQTRHVIERYLKFPKTPSGRINRWLRNQGGYIDPATNQWVVLPISGGPKVAAAHIYPSSKIKEFPGFTRLTKAQQDWLLNHPDNFMRLETQWNSSMGNRLADEWVAETIRGKLASKAFVNELRERQQAFQRFAKEMIKFWLAR